MKTSNFDMKARSARQALPLKKKVLFILVSWLFLAALFLLGGEIVLRLKGVQPWANVQVSTVVEPGGKLFIEHPTLGYSHIPGAFNIMLETGYSFNITHLPNSMRITQPIGADLTDRGKKEIWIFGGSFTHGWSLNDEETFPWLIQERFPANNVVNFGVGGYGTIHSLIQFREALESQQPPEVAVVAYASFHDERNTFLRNRRKTVTSWNNLGPLMQPYARLGSDGGLLYSFADVDYRGFPLMRYSALIHYLEQKYTQLEDSRYDSNSVSKAILNEMHQLAKKNNVQFVVAGITEHPITRTMLDYARSQGIPAIDISVNLSKEGYRNLPYDWHPSPIANRLYADKLGTFLEEKILRQEEYRAPPLYARAESRPFEPLRSISTIQTRQSSTLERTRKAWTRPTVSYPFNLRIK